MWSSPSPSTPSTSPRYHGTISPCPQPLAVFAHHAYLLRSALHKCTEFSPGEGWGVVEGALAFLAVARTHFPRTQHGDTTGSRWCASIHFPRPRVVGLQERIAKSPKLKMAITAGIGSDHVDLQAAMKRKIDVVEVTYCNSECVPCMPPV
jgi:hypothetical protein